MSERIEAYLAELDRRLARRVPEKRRSELIAELRSHLHLRAKDAGEDEAQTLEALGPLDLVAEDLIRSESGVDTRSPWRLAAIPLGALLVGAAVLQFMIWVLHLETLPYTEMLIGLEYAILATFALCVWRSRRWLVLPIAVAFLALDAVGYVEMAVVYHPIDIGHEVLAGNVEAARVEPVWPPPPSPGRAVDAHEYAGQHGYYVPGRSMDFKRRIPFGFGTSISVEVSGYDTVYSPAEARRRWESDGRAFLGQGWRSLASDFLFRIGWSIGVFALLNALILRLDARRRRLIHRKSRLA